VAPTRRPVIAGNWKMYKTASEGAALARALRDALEGSPADRDVVVAPPFPALAAVADILKGGAIGLAAQNMHHEKEGAFTGEVSAPMLRDLGCSHVILGHSERRQHFGETDEGVARKAVAALAHGLVPVVCVGETLLEREAERTLEVVERQVGRALSGLAASQVAALLVAYEPVWAIGTGRVATPEQAQEVHAFIRSLVSGSHGAGTGAALRILYGGSVRPDNIGRLMAEADIDGALVGGASLRADSFLGIVRY
jgi:triosephosphate isomerase